jgi:hypothetical protein
MLLAWKASSASRRTRQRPSDPTSRSSGGRSIFIESFCPTLPGSEDDQVLWKKGFAMEADLNMCDVEHVCPRISREQWETIASPVTVHSKAHADAAAMRDSYRSAG